MSSRIRDLPAVQRWAALIGGAAPPRPAELRVIYGAWLAAFMLKVIGSSWDVAWHFRFLRDDFAPPHIINTVGTVLAFSLVLVQSYRGLAAERRGLRLTQFGMGLFLLAIPLDLLNHRLFGLDLTAWSPTHSLLYLGTALLIVGAMRSWLRVALPGAARTVYGLAFGAFLLEDVLFPLGQQEFGVLAIDAYRRGQSPADSELLALAGGDLPRLVLGGLPAWLYPAWLILGASFVLLALRRVLPVPWAATIVAGSYLLYRVLANAALTAGGFPPTFIPFMLLGGALALDAAAALRWGPLPTSLAIVVSFYAGAALVGRLVLMPDFPLAVAPVIGLLLWAGVWASRRGLALRPGAGPARSTQARLPD